MNGAHLRGVWKQVEGLLTEFWGLVIQNEFAVAQGRCSRCSGRSEGRYARLQALIVRPSHLARLPKARR